MPECMLDEQVTSKRRQRGLRPDEVKFQPGEERHVTGGEGGCFGAFPLYGYMGLPFFAMNCVVSMSRVDACWMLDGCLLASK